METWLEDPASYAGQTQEELKRRFIWLDDYRTGSGRPVRWEESLRLIRSRENSNYGFSFPTRSEYFPQSGGKPLGTAAEEIRRRGYAGIGVWSLSREENLIGFPLEADEEPDEDGFGRERGAFLGILLDGGGCVLKRFAIIRP